MMKAKENVTIFIKPFKAFNSLTEAKKWGAKLLK